MRRIIDRKSRVITTSDGRKYIRRVTTILRANGKYRYPVDYYDASPNVVRVSHEELERLRIPSYKQLI